MSSPTPVVSASVNDDVCPFTDAPAPRRRINLKSKAVVKPVAPPPVEPPPAETTPEETLDGSDDDNVSTASPAVSDNAPLALEDGEALHSEVDYKLLLNAYNELKAKYDALKAEKPRVIVKTDELPAHLHWRMLNGKKVKAQYMRDNGVSLYKEMKEGDKLVGVSCIQKGGIKSIKTIDYTNLVWVNKGVVRNADDNTLIAHKDGKFSIIKDGVALNARLMVIKD